MDIVAWSREIIARRSWSNLKWAINDNIKNTCPEFKDVIKNHFELKKNDIKKNINFWLEKSNLKKELTIQKDIFYLF